MQLKKTRSAAIVACVAALSAVAAGSAQAAVTAVTGPVTAVTADSATFTGTVTTGGVSAPWEFSYSLFSNSFVGSLTTGGTIPAGVTTPTSVTDTVTGLIPSTKYTVQLLSQNPGAGGYAYLVTPVFGGVMTFTTKGAGFAFLTSTKLKVKKGRIEVPIKCSKAFACDGGALAVTTRSKGKKVACGTATFGIKAGKKKTIKTSKVSPKCRTLLLAAPNTKIHAHLAATFTFQKAISKNVTVTFVS